MLVALLCVCANDGAVVPPDAIVDGIGGTLHGGDGGETLHGGDGGGGTLYGGDRGGLSHWKREDVRGVTSDTLRIGDQLYKVMSVDEYDRILAIQQVLHSMRHLL